MRARLLLLLAAVLAIVGIPAGLAAAKSAPTSSLRITYVDNSDPGHTRVGFTYDGSSKDVGSLKAAVDGDVVKPSDVVPLSRSSVPSDVLFVVDDSTQMGAPSNLAANRDALRRLILSTGENTGVAVASYGNTPTLLSTLDAPQIRDVDSIKDLATNQGDKSMMWDGLHTGLTELAKAPSSHQTAVVLISNGADNGSSSTVGDVRASLVQTGAALYVVAVGGQPALDGSGLATLVDQTGGRAVVVDKPGDVPGAMTKMQTVLDQRYTASLAVPAGSGQRDLQLQIGSTTGSASFSSGSVSNGVTELAAQPETKAGSSSILQSDLAKWLALAAVGLALGLAAYSIGSLMAAKQTALSTVLRPYADGPVEDDADDGALAQTAILQRAVELTEDFAERQGFLAKVESKLERADLPLRAAEALFFWAAGVVVIGLAALFMMGVMGGLVLTLVIAIFPAAALNFLATRRRKQFEAQLPDMLSLLSGSLRAGYSLMQGMEAVAQEVVDPMGKELRRVCSEARLGRDIEDALNGVAERMDSRDFEWAVMAIRIQREVGGNLSELLLTVADTMTNRERLRREVAALTAEGKMSAIVLGLMPPALGAFMFVSNPDYMHGLVSTGVGQGMLVGATVAMLVGFAWMKKIVDINI